MPKLIGSLSSPFVRKIRIALAEKNLPHEMVVDSPVAPDSKVPDYNPLGKVPVLLTDDDRAVYDSPVILEYLEVLQPAPALLPPPGLQRVSVRRWEALADGITEAALAIMNERRRENELQRSQEWIIRQQVKVGRGIAALSAELGENQWCHGDGLTVADIAVYCTLGYMAFRLPEIDWRGTFPNLDGYCTRLSLRPAFAQTAPPPA